jgi:putative tryptophan/tyrosine transport system substrate-binding protein
MRRRDFIMLLGGVAAIWPLAARTQQPIPAIGYLFGISAQTGQPTLAAFRKALADAGYVEGQNVHIEYRWADGHNERLPAMASDLVAESVAVIVTGGGDAPGIAAKAATSTIPIVIVTGSDPVKEGFVPNLNRPDGNVTGASIFSYEMESKRLGLLHEAVPAAKIIGALFNQSNPSADAQRRDAQEAASRLGVEVVPFDVPSDANTEAHIIAAFAGMVQKRAAALLVTADPVFNSHRALLIAQAAQYRLPAIYEFPSFVAEGGMMSYGTVLTDAYSQAGTYAGRILKGEKPGDLPFVLPTNFQFAINLKTAKALGVEIPPTLSARADEVIE